MILIISIMMTSFAVAIFADEDAEEITTEKETQDLDAPTLEDDLCYRAVTVLSALGIMQGKTESDFGKNDFLTRAEMSAIAVRFIGMDSESKGGTENVYSDVAEEHWDMNRRRKRRVIIPADICLLPLNWDCSGG